MFKNPVVLSACSVVFTLILAVVLHAAFPSPHALTVKELVIVDEDGKPRIRIDTYDEHDGPTGKSLAGRILFTEQDGRPMLLISQWYDRTSIEFYSPTSPGVCNLHLSNGPNGPTASLNGEPLR